MHRIKAVAFQQGFRSLVNVSPAGGSSSLVGATDMTTVGVPWDHLGSD